MPDIAIPRKRLHNALILVVDDVKLNRVMLVRSLASRGYTNVLLAQDGAEALRLTHERKPDLVILDLVMPGMDGFAYCQEVRRDSMFDNMPIMVQTMLENADDKVKAFHLGASDYICKPIDPDELSARTKAHLMKKMLIEDLHAYRSHVSAEMDAARAMQDRLMPDTQKIGMCERIFDMKIAAHFETSSALGGDCWGMRPLSDKKLAVYAYDFSGHGVSAALNVFRMHTIIQECVHASFDPGQFLCELNKRLHPLLERNEFATMFYGVIETEANCLLYAAAAAPSPMIFSRSDGEPVSLSGRGFPLGVLNNAVYETQYTPFLPGDLMLLFSDCLTETKNREGRFLSEAQIRQRVTETLRANSHNPAAGSVEAVLELLQTGGTPIADDLTLNAYWRCAIS